MNGGFVYINAEGRGKDWTKWSEGEPLEVQANAICVTGLVTLHFSEQIAIDMNKRAASLQRMRAEGRFQRITIVPLRQSGARYYSWIFPGEDLAADGDEPWVPAAGGGFMYLMSDEDEPTREECSTCYYYEHTVGHMN